MSQCWLQADVSKTAAQEFLALIPHPKTSFTKIPSPEPRMLGEGYSNWVKHRNKKRHSKDSHSTSFTSPSPRQPSMDPGESRAKWAPDFPTGLRLGPLQRQATSWALGSSSRSLANPAPAHPSTLCCWLQRPQVGLKARGSFLGCRLPSLLIYLGYCWLPQLQAALMAQNPGRLLWPQAAPGAPSFQHAPMNLRSQLIPAAASPKSWAPPSVPGSLPAWPTPAPSFTFREFTF